MLEVAWPLSIRRKLEGLLPNRLVRELVDHLTRSIRENHSGCSATATIQFCGPGDDGQVLCFASAPYTFAEHKCVIVDVEVVVVEQP
jgi:hypothetical protein